jgi:hypothetical protein
MTRFDRGSLSPLRIVDQPMDLPFGLTWEDISRTVGDVDGDRVSKCRAVQRYEIQGLRDRSRSVIMSLTYPTFDGAASIDVFVKRSPASAREADRHAQLEAAGVPVSRLLFDVEASDGDHVLGFEFLDTIGIDFDSSKEIAELLTLVATLNAVPASALGGSPNPPLGRPEAEFTASMERALMTAQSMGLLRWAALEVSEWLDLYAKAMRWATSMPAAVTHGEMYFQQVGRAAGGSLVVVDLATVGIRPRFSDLCNVTRGLGELTDWDETEVLCIYLDALRAAGVATPTVVDGLDELRRLRVLNGLQSMPWLTGALHDPGLGPTALEQNVETLRRDLSHLGIVGS